MVLWTTIKLKTISSAWIFRYIRVLMAEIALYYGEFSDCCTVLSLKCCGGSSSNIHVLEIRPWCSSSRSLTKRAAGNSSGLSTEGCRVYQARWRTIVISTSAAFVLSTNQSAALSATFSVSGRMKDNHIHSLVSTKLYITMTSVLYKV